LLSFPCFPSPVPFVLFISLGSSLSVSLWESRGSQRLSLQTLRQQEECSVLSRVVLRESLSVPLLVLLVNFGQMHDFTPLIQGCLEWRCNFRRILLTINTKEHYFKKNILGQSLTSSWGERRLREHIQSWLNKRGWIERWPQGCIIYTLYVSDTLDFVFDGTEHSSLTPSLWIRRVFLSSHSHASCSWESSRPGNRKSEDESWACDSLPGASFLCLMHQFFESLLPSETIRWRRKQLFFSHRKVLRDSLTYSFILPLLSKLVRE
jgi:hypothetical protein